MSNKREEYQEAVRYLLGDFSEAEQTSAEERFFADENFSRLLDAAENDLIDEYVRGELTEKQRRNFESHFLISERRREKVRAAQILQNMLFAAEKQVVAVQPKNSFWQSLPNFFHVPNLIWAGSLAAIALFALVGVWLATRTGDNQIAQISNLKTENLNLKVNPQNQPPANVSWPPQNIENTNVNQTPDKKLPSEKRVKSIEKRAEQKKPAVSAPTFAALILTPMTRSSETPDFVLPRLTRFLRLQLINDDANDFIRYRVEIRNPNGVRILAHEIPAKINQKLVVLQIPAEKLTSGSHEIILTGSETVGGAFKIINFYNFSLLKK